MGLMDKVKNQAAVLADRAQEGARLGQERLAQLQGSHQSNALLLEMGGLVYLARAGRPVEGSDARINELTRQLAAFESTNGPITVTPAVAPPGTTGSYVPGGAGNVGASMQEPDRMTNASTASTNTPGSSPAGAGVPPVGNAKPPSPTGGIPTATYASDSEPADPGAR